VIESLCQHSSNNNTTQTVHYTLDVFSSLRLLGTEYYHLTAYDYDRTDATESISLVAGGASYGRVVYDTTLPSWEDTAQHVFLEITDPQGSTSSVIDRDSSELVEQVTYLPFGQIDTDYRPTRWHGFREGYQYTGKEDDYEVGLTYFGARYYSEMLSRWASADPLTIHAMGSDLNPYRFVHNSPISRVDPTGLDDGDDGGGDDGGGSGPSAVAAPTPPPVVTLPETVIVGTPPAAQSSDQSPTSQLDAVAAANATFFLAAGTGGGGGASAPRLQGASPGQQQLSDIASYAVPALQSFINFEAGANLLAPADRARAESLGIIDKSSDEYGIGSAGGFVLAVVEPEEALLAGAIELSAESELARESGILRDAARGSGNFGLGAADSATAQRLGEAWVGDGAKVASDGKTLVSSDGLRQFRPPSFRPFRGTFQANFERRAASQGQWNSNGHLDIIFGPEEAQ
jgi:RHS repeat-associated protein